MISIIIPAHNEQKNLQSLLPHLVMLTEGNTVEVIVALSSENSDNSATILKHDAVSYFKCIEKGRAVQMNKAAELSKGDVLVFLHADVIPPTSFLNDIRTTLNDGYEAGFFSYRFDNESFLLKINASFTAKESIFTGGGDQCLFIKKTVFNSLGGFDESQVVMEDFEFFERMKKSEVRFKIIKNDLIVSSRKYQCNSYLRVNLSNLLLVTLFKLGYSAKKLKSLHNKLIRTPYQNSSQ
ncbi:TIGR04283 family arsenosugar biosynthesis glycosyltransferase [Aurantibacter crassamenti]|uniref:TIGR04283 family arsenosugar biosynthesis glycosyltransferase n=1 Tax=Aurantibacter crassamenti TaxID=1837375 RepID=UPI00193A7C46|nr:TIGR04283 family arsenosugar biosynthesis glycosyltransferase [Aurantibacter crassamenti]MBM1107647.1 TIGR04283 family arsenosugar biosynthesis glycosyltransferase [Aurantibacter crassamenti]